LCRGAAAECVPRSRVAVDHLLRDPGRHGILLRRGCRNRAGSCRACGIPDVKMKEPVVSAPASVEKAEGVAEPSVAISPPPLPQSCTLAKARQEVPAVVATGKGADRGRVEAAGLQDLHPLPVGPRIAEPATRSLGPRVGPGAAVVETPRWKPNGRAAAPCATAGTGRRERSNPRNARALAGHPGRFGVVLRW